MEILEAISIIKEVPTSGHSPLQVICENHSQYYVKNGRGRIPPYQIISEILCHYFLKLWGIKTPKICLIKISGEILNNNYSRNHLAQYYDTYAFGSKVIEASTDLSIIFDIVNSKFDYNRFADPLDFLKIALFDIWVDNDDRKPSNFNLLLNSEMEFIAIDHAYTFCTMAYGDLIEEVAITHNSSILDTFIGRKIVYYASKDVDLNTQLQEYFADCVHECKINFDEIVDNIPDEFGFTESIKNSVQRFLFSEKRNEEVFSTLINWL